MFLEKWVRKAEKDSRKCDSSRAGGRAVSLWKRLCVLAVSLCACGVAWGQTYYRWSGRLVDWAPLPEIEVYTETVAPGTEISTILADTNPSHWATSSYSAALFTTSGNVLIPMNPNPKFDAATERPIGEGVTLYVPSGIELTVSNQFNVNGIVINYGTINKENSNLVVHSDGKIFNYGNIDIAYNIENNGRIENSGTLKTSTNITNKGTIINSGSIIATYDVKNDDAGAVFDNSGDITGNSVQANSGSFTNTGTIDAATTSGTVTGGHYVLTGTNWTQNSSWQFNRKPDVTATSTDPVVIDIKGDVTNIPAFTGNAEFVVNLYNNVNIKGTSNRVSFSGQKNVTINLHSNATITGDLDFLRGTTYTINLNGYSLTITETLNLTKEWKRAENYGTPTDSGEGAILNVNGSGKVTTKGFDTDNGYNTFVNLSSLVDFYITTTYYGNMDVEKWLTFTSDGTCNLYIPASGANVNWGDNKIRYDNITPKPNGEPKVYTMTTSVIETHLFSGTIVLTNSKDGLGGRNLTFDYEVKIRGTAKYKVDVKDFPNSVSDFSGNITLGADGDPTVQTKTINITLTEGTISAGEGIIIKVYTPDGSGMELGEFRYIKDEIKWTGAAGTTDWGTLGNWSGITAITDITSTSEVVIPSGCAKYPEIDETVFVGTITIKNNAHVTLASGGTLNVSTLEAEGTGYISGASGTVNFAGTSFWEAAYPEFSSFPDITIASGATFTQNSDLYISGNFTNSGTFNGGTKKTVFQPSGASSTITGNGIDTTKFGTIVCERQENKELSFEGNISAQGLTLSGVADSAGKRLKIISSSGATIALANSQVGRYLDLTGTPPTITDSTGTPSSDVVCTVYNSQGDWTSTPTNLTDLGWILGDPNDFVWVGRTNDWNNRINWNTNSVPDAGKNVIIPGGVSLYPKLESDINLGSGKVEIKSGGSIDFNGHGITATGGFTNAGTIETSEANGNVKITGNLTNSGNVTASGTLTVDGDATFTGGKVNGSVEVTGTGAGNVFFTTNKTEIDGNLSAASMSVTSGTAQINGTTTITGELSVSGDGNLSINRTDDASSSAGTVSFNTAGNINLGKNSGINFTVSNGDIVFPDTLASLTLGGTIKASESGKKIIFRNGTSTLAVDTTFVSPVEVGADISFTNGKSITFSDKVSSAAGGIYSLTIGASGAAMPVTFNDEVSVSGDITIVGDTTISSTLDATSVSITGNTTLGKVTVTTSGNQTYTGSVTLNNANDTDETTLKSTGDTSAISAGTVSGKGILVISGTTTTDKTTTFTPSGNVGVDLAIAGNVTLGSDLTATKNLTVNTGATLTANVSIDAQNGALTNKGTVAGTGTITVTGTLDDSTGTWSHAGTLNLNGTGPQKFKVNNTTTYPTVKVGTNAAVSIRNADDTAAEDFLVTALTLEDNATLSAVDITVGNLTTKTGSTLSADDLTISTGVTNGGTISLTGNLTSAGNSIGGTVEFTGATDVGISGITTFNNLTIKNDSTTDKKTVKFPAVGTRNDSSAIKISVNGNFKVDGTTASDENNIVLTTAHATPNATAPADDVSSTWWYLIATPAKVDVDYADIIYAYSENNISSGVKEHCKDVIIEDDSTTPSTYQFTTHHWFGEHKYYWFVNSVATDGNWSTKENWALDENHTKLLAAAPSKDDSTAAIIVLEGDSSTSHILTLDGDVSVKSIEIEDDVIVDFGEHSVTTTGKLTNGGKIKLVGAVSQEIAGGFKDDNAGTVEYSGAFEKLAITGIDPIKYYDLIFTELTTTTPVTLTDNIEVTNDFSINDVAGEITFNGTVTVGNDLKITQTENITFGGATSVIGKTTINSGVGKSVSFTGTTDTFDEITVEDATFSIAASLSKLLTITGTVTLGGNLSSTSDITIAKTGSLSTDTYDITAKNLTIDSDGTDNGSLTVGTDVTPGSGTITLSGDFTNNGTFNCGEGTVKITGSGKSKILGANTFYNFTCTDAGKTILFEGGKEQTVTGKITITGTAGDGNLITLTTTDDVSDPNTASRQWNLVITSDISKDVSTDPLYDSSYRHVVDITYAYVSHSTVKATYDETKYSDLVPLNLKHDPKNCIDGGGTEGWFKSSIYVWIGKVSSDWNDADNWTDDKGAAITNAPDITDSDNENKIRINPDPEDGTTYYELKISVSSPAITSIKAQSITINEGATADFGNCNLTVNPNNALGITVNGTLKLSGVDLTNPQTLSGKVINNGAIELGGGTVKFTGVYDGKDGNITEETITPDDNTVIIFTGSDAIFGNFDATSYIVKMAGTDKQNFTITNSAGVIFGDVNFANTDTTSGVTVDGDFTAANITNSSILNLGSGTITVNEDFTNEAGGTVNADDGTLAVTKKFTNKGTCTFNVNDSTLTVGENFINEDTAIFSANTDKGTLTVSGNVINEGTINGSSGEITVEGNFTNEATGKFTANTGTLNVDGNLTNVGEISGDTNKIEIRGNFTNSGICTVDSDELTIGGDFTNKAAATFTAGTGTLTVEGNLTNEDTGIFNRDTGTVIITGTGASTISGITSFNNLTIQNDKTGTGTADIKTVIFPAVGNIDNSDAPKIVISGNFTVAGKTITVGGDEKNNIVLTTAGTPSADSPASGVDSPWWYLAPVGGTVSVKNADVGYSYSEVDLTAITDAVVSCTEIEDSTCFTTINWFKERTYYWHGRNALGWSSGANWSTSATSTEGMAATAGPGLTETTARIVIVKGSSDSASPYILKLSDDISVKSIRVEKGATVDFAGQNVTVDTAANGKITNNGTIRLIGTSTQSISDAMVNGNDSANGISSTVEYYGEFEKLVWDVGATTKEYVNLNFKDLTTASGAVTLSDNIDILNDLTITGTTGGIEFSGEIGVSHDLIIDGTTGSVTLGGVVAIGNDLSIDTKADVSFTGKDTVTGKTSINATDGTNEKTVTFTSSDTTFGNAITVNNAIFSITPEIGVPLSVTGNAALGGELKSTDDVVISKTGSLSTSTNNYNLTARNLTIEVDSTDNTKKGTLTAGTSEITLTGYLTNAGEITSSGSMSVGGNLTNSGEIKGDNTGIISVSGDIDDSAGTWSHAGTLNLNGTVAKTFKTNPSTEYPTVNVNTDVNIVKTDATLGTIPEDFGVKNLTIVAGKTLSAKSLVISTGGTFGIYITSSADDGTLKLYGSLTNKGLFNADNSTVEFVGTEDCAINGVFKFNNLTIQNDKTGTADDIKTVKFPAVGNIDNSDAPKIEISGNFTVAGKTITVGEDEKNNIVLTTSDDKPSAVFPASGVDSPWWYLAPVTGTVSVTNADIGYSYSEDDISGNVTNCKELLFNNAEYTTYHWFGGHTYYWFGRTSEVWTTSSNWSVKNSYTAISQAPYETDETATIVIVEGASDTSSPHILKLLKDISVKSLIVEADAIADFGSCNITTVFGITNDGTIRLEGAGQTITSTGTGSAPMTNGTGSIIEYYGSSFTGLAWDGDAVAPGNQFENVIFKDAVDTGLGNPVVIDAKGYVTFENDAKFADAEITADGVITFTDTIGSTGNAKIASSESIDFAKPATFADAEITADGVITFEDAVDSSGNAKINSREEIDFGGVATFADAEITADGAITFTDTIGSTGNAKIASSESIDFAKPATFVDAEITAGSTITFSDTIKSTGTATITAAGKIDFTDSAEFSKAEITSTADSIDFKSDVTSADTVTIIANGAIDFSGSVNFVKSEITSTTDAIDFKSDVTATDLTSINAKTTIDFAKPVTFVDAEISAVNMVSFADIVTFDKGTVVGDVMLTKNLEAKTSLEFRNHLYLYGSPSSLVTFSGKNIKIDGNFIIAYGKDSEVNLNVPITVEENIVRYTGDLKVNKNLTSGKDIVLLGKEYHNKDGGYVHQRISNIAYSYKGFDEGTLDSFPNGDPLPTVTDGYSGDLTVDAGVIVKVGQNFYANGITMSGPDVWYLDVRQSIDSFDSAKAVCFVEACSSKIENSHVRCYETSGGTAINPPKENYGIGEDILASGLGSFCEDGGGNKNWDLVPFKICNIYTITDNVVRVELSAKMRNSTANELSGNVDKIKFKTSSGADEGFVSVYKKYDIRSQKGKLIVDKELLKIGDDVSYDSEKDIAFFYLETASTWNTDATGTSTGNSLSTDSHGNHKNVIPAVKFTTAGRFINENGKILENVDEYFDGTIDRASPVLTAVYASQETHVQDAADQHSYDAHNYLEFIFSEPVDFGDKTDASIPYMPCYEDDGMTLNTFENERVTSDFGKIENVTSGLSVAGLVKINSGELKTGIVGKLDNTVHAFYRSNPHTIRISIAGLTDGTVTDNDGNEYKKWIGYIDSAKTPQNGSDVELVSDKLDFVNDLAITDVYDEDGNYVETQKTPNACIAFNSDSLKINVSSSKTYPMKNDAGWDVKKPSFAVYRKASVQWDKTSITDYEIVGSTVDGTSSLKRIEFHVFDNEPSYDSSDKYQWVSKEGWVKPGETDANKNPILYKDYSYAADIFGGARPFDSTDATSGGVRYCTVANSSYAFRYMEGIDGTPNLEFDSGKKAFAGSVSPIFQPITSPSRNPSGADGLYFGYNFVNTILSLRTRFTVSYDSAKGYITDLAGNRLGNGEKIQIRTKDLTPPSFNMTVAPVGQNKLYIMFAKPLSTGTVILKDADGALKQKKALEDAYPNAFELYELTNGTLPSPATDISVDKSVPAKVLYQNNDYMGLELILTRNVTLEDVKKLYVVAKPEEEIYKDPIIDVSTKLTTFIHDSEDNYMAAYSAHALSDFAVDVINPLYAYNDWSDDSGNNIQNELYGESSKAVHDWDAEQQNYGSLLTGKEIHIIASKNGDENFNGRIYFDNNPPNETLSTEYNAAARPFENWRIWLPKIEDYGMFTSLAKSDNAKVDLVLDGQDGGEDYDLEYIITKEHASQWSAGDQVSFLFSLHESNGDLMTITHVPVYDYENEIYSLSDKFPLFALRLKTPGDLTSLDLWSFRLKEQKKQRGGVTILNNVINPTKSEKTVIKIDNPTSGKVDVILMTLDGNVVDYLNRGNLDSGTHFFIWTGKTRSGKTVARGMYFVRIIGNGFDETRKVMVIK